MTRDAAKYAMTGIDLDPLTLAVTPMEACKILSLKSRSTLYKHIRAGDLKVRRLGQRRTLIDVQSLRDFYNALPEGLDRETDFFHTKDAAE